MELRNVIMQLKKKRTPIPLYRSTIFNIFETNISNTVVYKVDLSYISNEIYNLHKHYLSSLNESFPKENFLKRIDVSYDPMTNTLSLFYEKRNTEFLLKEESTLSSLPKLFKLYYFNCLCNIAKTLHDKDISFGLIHPYLLFVDKFDKSKLFTFDEAFYGISLMTFKTNFIEIYPYFGCLDYVNRDEIIKSFNKNSDNKTKLQVKCDIVSLCMLFDFFMKDDNYSKTYDHIVNEYENKVIMMDANFSNGNKDIEYMFNDVFNIDLNKIGNINTLIKKTNELIKKELKGNLCEINKVFCFECGNKKEIKNHKCSKNHLKEKKTNELINKELSNLDEIVDNLELVQDFQLFDSVIKAGNEVFPKAEKKFGELFRKIRIEMDKYNQLTKQNKQLIENTKNDKLKVLDDSFKKTQELISNNINNYKSEVISIKKAFRKKKLFHSRNETIEKIAQYIASKEEEIENNIYEIERIISEISNNINQIKVIASFTNQAKIDDLILKVINEYSTLTNKYCAILNFFEIICEFSDKKLITMLD